MMISRSLLLFVWLRLVIKSGMKVIDSTGNQKSINTSPVSGSAELTILGEVVLFNDCLAYFLRNRYQARSDGIFAPYMIIGECISMYTRGLGILPGKNADGWKSEKFNTRWFRDKCSQ